MKRIVVTLLISIAALASLSRCTEQATAKPAAQQVARGEYLVRIGGCNDRHPPLKMGPKGPEPDWTPMLSGHPANLVMPAAPKPSGPWMWSGAATNTAFAG